MNLKDPTITIVNTDGNCWQLTAQGLLSGVDGLESVSFTVLTPRSEQSLPKLTNVAIQRAIELLHGHLSVAR